MFDRTNEIGKIHFSENVIYKICADAVNKTGDVRIQNYKGRYTAKKPGLLNAFSSGEEDYDDIELEQTEDSVRITVYIVVRFGVSISNVAAGIIDHIYEQMEEVMGVKPAFVRVIVTGTASKTIAKRHIEFSR